MKTIDVSKDFDMGLILTFFSIVFKCHIPSRVCRMSPSKPSLFCSNRYGKKSTLNLRSFYCCLREKKLALLLVIETKTHSSYILYIPKNKFQIRIIHGEPLSGHSLSCLKIKLFVSTGKTSTKLLLVYRYFVKP